MLIDTHKAVRDLTEVGVPQEQAERFVEVVTRADEQVATKADLDALEERLTRKMWRAAFASAGLPASLVAALLAVFRFLLREVVWRSVQEGRMRVTVPGG